MLTHKYTLKFACAKVNFFLIFAPYTIFAICLSLFVNTQLNVYNNANLIIFNYCTVEVEILIDYDDVLMLMLTISPKLF